MAPASIKEKELLINVDSPVWLQQLTFYKDTIIKKLNGFGIKTVKFKIGRVLPEKKQDKTILEKRLLTANENSYIEGTVSPVPDQELRDKIKKAMEKSMAFKKIILLLRGYMKKTTILLIALFVFMSCNSKEVKQETDESKKPRRHLPLQRQSRMPI